MRLLKWTTLQPQGASNLAAILFPAPVRLASIRVFPAGAQPFTQCPDIVAQTEPDAFVLELFLNASIIPGAGSAQEGQHRGPKNILSPTRLVYTGSPTDYEVDMGPDYATRLIIFKGDFVNLSLALYGDLVVEKPEVDSYVARALPTIQPTPVSRVVHPLLSTKPQQLAEQLLGLLDEPPPLSLIVRLMFCLKPPDKDWDHPSFPYLYTDLDADDQIFDLEALVEASGRPIPDNVTEDVLVNFANRVNDFIGARTSDEVYDVAKLLSIAAPQSSLLATTLLSHLDIASIFDADNMSDATILCLYDAASNSEIARHFASNETFQSILQDLEATVQTDPQRKASLEKLFARIEGWKAFEDGLCNNAEPDYPKILSFLFDLTSEEFALGSWIECMLHVDTFARVLHDDVITPSGQHPVQLFQGEMPSGYSEFVGFVRALVGVSCTLAVVAWADSTGKEICRERSLAVLALWQGVDGYREIINRGLLLRQLTRRLGWISNEENTRESCVLAERLIVALAKDSNSFLKEDFASAILRLEEPFFFIESEEFMVMKKLAQVSEGGISSALEELAFSSDHPFSLRRLRVLRTALAIVEGELATEDGDMRVIQAFWESWSQALNPRLVTILQDVAADLKSYLLSSSIPLPKMNQALAGILFHTSVDIIRVVPKLMEGYPIGSRDLRLLTTTLMDIIISSDKAHTAYAVGSPASAASTLARSTCTSFLYRLTGPGLKTDSAIPTALICFKALLQHAIHPQDNRDPTHHILQVRLLISELLAIPKDPSLTDNDLTRRSHIVTHVFPKVLHDLKVFAQSLDSVARAYLLSQLVLVDQGETGIADWLFIELLKPLSEIVIHLAGMVDHEDLQLVLQHRVAAILSLCDQLVQNPETLTWFVDRASNQSSFGDVLRRSLSDLLDGYYSSPPLTRFVTVLAQHATQFDGELQLNIVLTLFRIAQVDPFTESTLDDVPSLLQSLTPSSIAIGTEQLRNEFGRFLSSSSQYLVSIKENKANKILSIFEWLSTQENTKLACLVGISMEIFNNLCSALQAALPPERQQTLESVKLKFSIDEDEIFNQSATILPTNLSLPLRSIQNLLTHPSSSTSVGNGAGETSLNDSYQNTGGGLVPPSTPKGQKTPEILGPIISPPTAVLRSPAATGLTKTYANNDFRQLRQNTSTRLNTSRMPSTHVDQFEPPSPELLAPMDPSLGFQGLSQNM